MTTTTTSTLPLTCYATNPSDGALIILKRGETGYWPTEGYKLGDRGSITTWDAFADLLNERMGVTKGQRAAMEAGSLFGWHVPGANPDHYDAATGRLRQAPQRYHVRCTVSGGVTGHRTALLKDHGEVRVFETREAAEAECQELLRANGPNARAQFSYTPERAS